MSTEHTWRKSSFSQPENNCVELTTTAIRDSKNPAGPWLMNTDLAGLIAAAKAGQFDRNG